MEQKIPDKYGGLFHVPFEIFDADGPLIESDGCASLDTIMGLAFNGQAPIVKTFFSEQELTAEQIEQVTDHLQTCKKCRLLFDTARLVVKKYRANLH